MDYPIVERHCMKDTKELILLTALKRFATDGYEAASIGAIAGELGMAKSALYKHYQNKRALLTSIVEHMRQTDYQRAAAYGVPEQPLADMTDKYRATTPEAVKAFTLAQFKYWTEDPFASAFRRMLTLEQYRSPDMAALYRQYLSDGPLSYLADLFNEMDGGRSPMSAARRRALAFYASVYMLIGLYDAAPDKAAVLETAAEHINYFKFEAII